MTSLTVARSPAEASDPAPDASVWQLLEHEARRLATEEPLLRRRLHHLLAAETPQAMLAGALSRRLADDELPAHDLHALMLEVLHEAPGLLAHAARDLRAVKQRDPACPSLLHVLLNLKGFLALQAHRVAHRLWQQERRQLAHAIAGQVAAMLSIDIHPAAHIGSAVMLDHASGIVIGETAVVEDEVSILQGVTLGGTGKEHGDRHPKVRRGVMIGAGAKILGNIEIGAMSKVAAGSVVLQPVPPRCTVAGVPARVVRRHGEGHVPAEEMDQGL